MCRPNNWYNRYGCVYECLCVCVHTPCVWCPIGLVLWCLSIGPIQSRFGVRGLQVVYVYRVCAYTVRNMIHNIFNAYRQHAWTSNWYSNWNAIGTASNGQQIWTINPIGLDAYKRFPPVLNWCGVYTGNKFNGHSCAMCRAIPWLGQTNEQINTMVWWIYHAKPVV